jgi:hypothetical protein
MKQKINSSYAKAGVGTVENADEQNVVEETVYPYARPALEISAVLDRKCNSVTLVRTVKLDSNINVLILL